MNIDLKIEAEKIALEVVEGTVDQACYEFDSFLGNYRFLTSSYIEKKLLIKFGTHLSKHVKKNPEGFLAFCKMVWNKKVKDGRIPLGPVLASLESIVPDKVIPEIIDMCTDVCSDDELDALVNGFEPEVLKEPKKYFPVLASNIRHKNKRVGRLVLITLGHMMYRYKSEEVTSDCLELMRAVISNGNDEILKTSSWVIGSYGVRADQYAVSDFMLSFSGDENESVVWTFSEAFRRSKIALQPDVARDLVGLFGEWSSSSNPDISRNAKNALKYLGR